MNLPSQNRMTDAPCGGASDFVEALGAQRDVYQRLRALVDRQRSQVECEDPAGLLSLLADRRRLTSELTDLATRLGPIEDRWSALRGSLSSEQDAQIRLSLREIRETLAHITSADEADVRVLEVRRRQVGSAINGIPAGRDMLAAYGRSSAPASGTFARTDSSR